MENGEKHEEHENRCARNTRHSIWVLGLGSLFWLLLRSGTKPRRLAYPCQQAALTSSVGFVGYLLSIAGGTYFVHRLRSKKRLVRGGVLFLVCAVLATMQTSAPPYAQPVFAEATLPSWTSTSAISDVFVVPDVPIPDCSLDGGALPPSAPCNDPAFALRDVGVDTLVDLMRLRGSSFYRTAQYPDGIVGSNDVVVIKINNQWGGDGTGRGATNTDVLKGLIWRILQHPDGFAGEVVVAENTQNVKPGQWNNTPANSEDQNQSILDVVTTFQALGYAVSTYSWDSINDHRIKGGSVTASGYPVGEYASGNADDAYILLEDPDGSGTDELSYPKFQTDGGSYVSMRYGIWNGSGYDADRLTFINLPVLKRHSMAGSTVAWKHLIGFVTAVDPWNRYGGWNEMHRFYWGYDAPTGDSDFGLLGRQLAFVTAPDLNIVDAVWVTYGGHQGGSASRQNVLLASSDPFAVDWYASEYVLYPLVSTNPADSSAARGGTFRSATRTNQNVAAAVWQGGAAAYPYIDLLDSYDGATPSPDEMSQINVYKSGEVLPPSLGVEKSASAGSVIAGQTFTYTISYINDGLGIAENVYISDTLPLSTTFDSVADASPPWPNDSQPVIGTESPTTLTWYTSALAPMGSGATGSIIYRVKVDAMVGTNAITNGVVITSSSVFTPEHSLADESSVLVKQAPKLSLEPYDSDKLEGNIGSTNYVFRVERSDNLEGEVTVSYSVTGSGPNPADADDFEDGNFPNGTVLLADSQDSQSVNVPVQGDLYVEKDEGFDVTLTSPSGGAILAKPSATGTIRNDDTVGLEVSKLASVDIARPGDTIVYSYRITNTGEVDLVNVSAVDNKLGEVTLDRNDLAPGQAANGTASYTVQQSDLPGTIANQVTATAAGVGGQETVATASQSVTLVEHGARLFVSKVASLDRARPGDKIVYSYRITNTGEVDLFNVSAVDDQLGEILLDTDSLAPDGAATGSASYTVTESDLPDVLTNTVTATARDSTGLEVLALADEQVFLHEQTNRPDLVVSKLTHVERASPGDSIVYTYLVTNTGDMLLESVVVRDDRLGDIGLDCSQLEPSHAAQGNAIYLASLDDLPGPIVNTVTVTATVGREAITRTASASVALQEHGEDSAALSIDVTVSTGAVLPGSTIDYDYRVINTGEIALRNLKLSDTWSGSIPLSRTLLQPTEAATGTVSYQCQENISIGKLTNVVNVTADGVDGSTVSDSASFTVTIIDPALKEELRLPLISS